MLADVNAAGEASIVMRLALDDGTSMPCPIWSADGRWIAFIAESDLGRSGSIPDAADAWLVDTQTGDRRRLTGVAATDIEWAPDGSQLYIAGNDGISIYSLAEGGARVLADTALTRMVAVSPDGQTLAVERRRINAAERFDLVLMNADGSDERVLVEDYTQMYGLGPVRSPDGNSVVFQRSCQTYIDPSGDEQRCYPQHEVVVVTTGTTTRGVRPGHRS